MNTATRRFILHLAVGLLAFLLGVGTAWALGGLNPFQSSSGTRYYRHKRCGSYRSWAAPIPQIPSERQETAAAGLIFTKGPHGCRSKVDFGEQQLPAPTAPATLR